MAYTKFHDPWTTSDLHLSSGAAWNHIETQWTAIKADADAHNHDTRYYTKASADATFFSTSFYTGFDCDLLDGQHFSDLLAAVMPLGAIMIWSGTDANVPSGWHICDGGTYGGKASPDLRDRFVIGAGGAYAVNATGGPDAWNGAIAATGTTIIGTHQLTTDEMPLHSHGYTDAYRDGDTQPYGINNPGNPCLKAPTSGSINTAAMSSGDGAHGHPGSSVSIAVDPRPLYYSLYYIMKYA